ncbi:hypothetical protein DL96DRAFT_1084494 [Flagelloscypha sp. PMI_526]|nr:hypothetical protein DL96DRAFT_1084494 [Flagelloscypha sp. PMI_526]
MVPSAFQSLISSSPFLQALDISIDPDEKTSKYSHFLRRSLRHPALRRLGLSGVSGTLKHLNSLGFHPKPTEIQAAFGTSQNTITDWTNIFALTSLSKVQTLTVRNIGYSISAFNALANNRVTRLNLAVIAVDKEDTLPSFLRQFTQLTHLTLAFHPDDSGFIPFDMIRVLSHLVKEPLELFEVYIPTNWTAVPYRLWWNQFSCAARSSSTLRLVRLYFAGYMMLREQHNLISQMISTSLSTKNISIIENGKGIPFSGYCNLIYFDQLRSQICGLRSYFPHRAPNRM